MYTDHIENFINNAGWTKREFDSIFMREHLEKKRLVLPVWHDVSAQEVYEYSPSLLDVYALNWEMGEEEVIRKLHSVLVQVGLNLQENNSMQYGFDPDRLLLDKIVLNKIDAARMQLEAAVKMFFFEWDAVSQHTLVGVAHGIFHDLARKRGIEGSIKDSPLIRPEERKEFIAAVNAPQNYFKHAVREDNDIQATFYYKVTRFYLFDAILLFVKLGGAVTYTLKVFLLRFQLRYPDLLQYEPAEETLRRIRDDAAADPQARGAGMRVARRQTGSSPHLCRDLGHPCPQRSSPAIPARAPCGRDLGAGARTPTIAHRVLISR
jgi:hypothetical protein